MFSYYKNVFSYCSRTNATNVYRCMCVYRFVCVHMHTKRTPQTHTQREREREREREVRVEGTYVVNKNVFS